VVAFNAAKAAAGRWIWSGRRLRAGVDWHHLARGRIGNNLGAGIGEQDAVLKSDGDVTAVEIGDNGVDLVLCRMTNERAIELEHLGMGSRKMPWRIGSEHLHEVFVARQRP